MFSIAWPWLLLLLPLPWLFKSKKVAKSSGGHLQLPGIADAENVVTASPDKPSRKLYWIMWLCLLCSLTRPQWLGEPIELPSEGRDLMLAVDLSGSMQIQDMVVEGKTVDRLTLIKHVIGDFIERRNGDRLGLILFADHAYLQAPLTQDRRSVAKFLADSEIGLVGKQTAIGESIALAVRRFDTVNDSNRVLILLTDGSNNAGNIEPEVAARIAAERNVTIYTVGVGAEVLERRSIFGTEKVNPSLDLDETQLQKLADMTNGHYFRARNSEELAQIYQKIDELEPVSRDQLTYRPKNELFYWPLLLALLASLVISLRGQITMLNNTKTTKEDK
ncbi:vWA domain-containing protein [Shewanella donghaensis]|uniref:vWA domain-containing protein n=1 Tax=Shewanella donghaensis TaxID=238836 RepID=UPI001183983D|nr:VWA domain-containing protein [Shewanella donghaensis]